MFNSNLLLDRFKISQMLAFLYHHSDDVGNAESGGKLMRGDDIPRVTPPRGCQLLLNSSGNSYRLAAGVPGGGQEVSGPY